MHQSQTRNPKKPLVRKNRYCVPPTKCSGNTFGVIRLSYKQQNEKNNSHDTNYTKIVARLTLECHELLNSLFLQTYYPWALAYYAHTQFSVPCWQNINICQYRLSQITLPGHKFHQLIKVFRSFMLFVKLCSFFFWQDFFLFLKDLHTRFFNL